MLDLYKNIKNLFVGEESFTLFIYGIIGLVLFTVIITAIDSKFDRDVDNFFNRFFPPISKFIDHYAYHIKGYCSKQIFMIFLVFILTFLFDSLLRNKLLNFIKNYVFIFFVLLSLRSYVNTKSSKRWFITSDNIYSLQSSNEDNLMSRGNTKNKRELDCDKYLTAIHSYIKCTE